MEGGCENSTKMGTEMNNFWAYFQRDGTVEGTSVTREQFAEKRASERSKPFRPKENAGILGDGDRAFQRETSNLSEFGPKRTERLEGRRPPNSDIFKVNGSGRRTNFGHI